MLAVTHLVLSHFRSHQHARLNCDGGPVAIYGPNGAGKTNLIEAISMLSPGRGLRRATVEDIARRPEAVGWKVTATIITPLGAHDVETRAEPGEQRSVRIDGKAAPQMALARIAPILWLVPSMDRLWIEAADGRRKFLDRATMSFVPTHAEAVLDFEKAMRERNRLLKDMVRDSHWYAALEGQMARTGVLIDQNRRAAIAALAAAQDQTETAFPAADLALVHPDTGLPTMEGDLQEAYAAGRARDMAAGRTLIGPHRSDLTAIWRAKNVSAADCSTGEQKALLISIILGNARALAGSLGAPPILLLDEVAAHLDAGRRASLYDEICGLGAQAFLTGTGPELFADLGKRAQYIEVTETNGTSALAERTAP